MGIGVKCLNIMSILLKNKPKTVEAFVLSFTNFN